MDYRIERMQGYLRAELSHRRTPAEAREFIQALAAAMAQSASRRVLIFVRNSRPIFKLQDYGIPEFFSRVAENPVARVALVSDTEEMRSSQQYIALLGREQGANVLAFADEASALDWLRGA